MELSVQSFQLVEHVLTLGYAAMAASLLYFILTIRTTAPKYRPSSVLSVVVMVSALLLLMEQQDSWVAAFTASETEGMMTLTGNFSNGFRYLNWLIDVPMLLIQILFIVGVTGAAFKKYVAQFAGAGMLMVLTGYIGQFSEPLEYSGQGGNVAMWLLWGVVSTVFYAFVLILITRVIKEGKKNLAKSKALPLFSVLLPLFYVSWTLYPLAYIMPVLPFEFGIVAQQVIYTIADVASKVIYGVILTLVGTMMSAEAGFEEAA
jgi:bacteriorhodopsin|tara:strand:+ start:18091 stop:18873 length:783 start_codon:yes stop_codon:yes gene_type:complete